MLQTNVVDIFTGNRWSEQSSAVESVITWEDAVSDLFSHSCSVMFGSHSILKEVYGAQAINDLGFLKKLDPISVIQADESVVIIEFMAGTTVTFALSNGVHASEGALSQLLFKVNSGIRAKAFENFLDF